MVNGAGASVPADSILNTFSDSLKHNPVSDEHPDEAWEKLQRFNAFKGEYNLPFTPAPQLQVVLQRAEHLADWHMDAEDCFAVGGLPDD